MASTEESLVVAERTPRPTFDLEEELRRDDGDESAEKRSVSQPAATTPSTSSSPEFAEYSDDTTLGQFILDRVGDAIKGLFRHSQTILRVDLRQALRYDVPLRRSTEVAVRARSTASTREEPGRLAARLPGREAEVVQERPWSHGLQGGGARLKLMQIWEFKNPETGEDRLPVKVNLGFGANVVMDRGEVQPKLRVRAQNLALHFFPDPYLEFRGKWPLGDTNLAVCARYRLPVSSMKNIWETRSEFRVYLCHRSGRVFHLTPGGLEFEDPKIPFGQFGTMRLAASVDFPRQLPLQDGEQPFRLRIMRLGVKSRIM